MTHRVLFSITLGILSASSASAQTSWGVVATPGSEIVFCDPQRNRVWRIDSAGALSPLLADAHCHAAVLGADGAVYGERVSAGTKVDASSGVSLEGTMGIWRYSAGGVHWILPATSRPDPSMWVVIDRNGRSFSWNGALPRSSLSQIVRREITGTATPLAGSRWGQRDGAGEAAQLGRVAGLALTPDGSLVVADSGNLRRVTSMGQVTTESTGTISDPDTGLVGTLGLWDRSIGVASDTTGAALVVDYPHKRIIRIARNGQVSVLWESKWGWRPAGVAALQSGFYVLEEWPMPAVAADLIGTPRVLRLGADGRSATIAAVSSWLVRGLTLLGLVIVASALRGVRGRARV